jgi:hypothetical protein
MNWNWDTNSEVIIHYSLCKMVGAGVADITLLSDFMINKDAEIKGKLVPQGVTRPRCSFRIRQKATLKVLLEPVGANQVKVKVACGFERVEIPRSIRGVMRTALENDRRLAPPKLRDEVRGILVQANKIVVPTEPLAIKMLDEDLMNKIVKTAEGKEFRIESAGPDIGKFFLNPQEPIEE